jgi:DNA polymerase III epsilon subunit-like protein
MVGTTGGRSALARLTVVSSSFEILLDLLIRPEEEITDYRTRWSGLEEGDLRYSTLRLRDAQLALARFAGPNTILVGHSLDSDLTALKIVHTRVIDTAILFPFRATTEIVRARIYTPKFRLAHLSAALANRRIQRDEDGAERHDAAEDASAALDLVVVKLRQVLGKEEAPTVTRLTEDEESGRLVPRVEEEPTPQPSTVANPLFPPLAPHCPEDVILLPPTSTRPTVPFARKSIVGTHVRQAAVERLMSASGAPLARPTTDTGGWTPARWYLLALGALKEEREVHGAVKDPNSYRAGIGARISRRRKERTG